MLAKRFALIISLIIIVIFIPLTTISIFIFINSQYQNDRRTINIIQVHNPSSFDPLDQWDSSSENVINQIAETLFVYNLSNTNYPLIPHLATSYSWKNTTCLRITIRNASFHDGTFLNAFIVKWNIDRWLYLTNSTRSLPENCTIAWSWDLFFFSDWVTPIINRSEVISEYKLLIYLNKPYSPILDLFTYTACAIISPNSTPFHRYLNHDTEFCIGTGPFYLIDFIPDSKLEFLRYENYWRELPYFEKVIFRYYDTMSNANQVMLSLNYDYLGRGSRDYYQKFESNPDIMLYNFTDKHDIPYVCYWYVGMDNKKIPSTIREALNYAYNYTFLIEKYEQGTIIKANSPISPAISGYDPNIKAPDFNITRAREVLQRDNYAPRNWDPVFGGLSEINWSSWEFNESFGTIAFNDNLNYWAYPESDYHEKTYIALKKSFKNIGIELEKVEAYWGFFTEDIPYHGEEIHLWSLGYYPDTLNPLKTFAFLYLNSSSYNWIQYQNTSIMNLIQTAESETDPSKLQAYYTEIQKTLVERDFATIPLFYDKLYFVHKKNLKGVNYNPMDRLYLYSMYRKD
jgi:peptide/nickel transport system substrate-binding protein